MLTSAAVIIYSERDEKFFFQVRSDDPEIWWPGRLGCFGGACEPFEKPATCLRRELNEELPNSFLSPLPLCVIQTDDRIRQYYVAKVDHIVDYQVAEGDGGKWVSLQDISELPRNSFVPMDIGVILHFFVD